MTNSDIRHDAIYVAIITIFFASIGVFVSVNHSVVTFGFGDNVLFHVAANWLRQGEVYIRDFVHFRTPGAYYYYATIQHLIGSSFRSTSFAILTETYVIQPACSLFFAWAASRAIIGRIHLPILIAIGACFFFVIPIFQLRTAVPLIGLAFYLFSLDSRRENYLLILCGLCLGTAFWFGQETFVFAVFAIFFAEMAGVGAHGIHSRLKRLTIIGASAAFALTLVIAVFWTLGVSPKELIYWFVWYSFVIQPGGMNIAYPRMSLENIFFFYPIAFLILSCAIFSLAGKLNQATTLVLGYACLRYVSALGRSDALHVGFAVSEIIVILPLALMSLAHIRISKTSLVKAAALAALLSLVFYAAATHQSSWMILAPLLLVVFSATSVPGLLAPIGRPVAILAALSTVALMYFSQMPHSGSFSQRLLSVPTIDPSKTALGVQFSDDGSREIRELQAFFDQNAVKSVFSYPHSPTAYALISKHPTRHVYFEPQVTDAEITETIDQLSDNPPDAIVQDFGQMIAMSMRLLPLADFISSRYQTAAIIRGHNTLEIQIPRDVPVATKRLVDRAFVSNSREAVAVTLEQAPNTPFPMPSLQVSAMASFLMDGPPNAAIVTAVLAGSDADAQEARLVITRNGREIEQILPGDGTMTEIAVPPGDGPFTVELHPGPDGRPSRWFNPVAVEMKKSP